MGLFNKAKFQSFRERQEEIKKHTIMIVDDEEANRRTLKSLLKDQYNLIEASDGQDALDRIQAMDQPDSIGLVISDQRMPRLTGTELFRELKSQLPRTMRIILSGYADPRDIHESQPGLYKFMNKPFNRKDLLQTVESALEKFDLQGS